MTACQTTGDMHADDPHSPRPQPPDAAVYVDKLFVFESRNRQARRAGESNGHSWCHLWSDDLEALHAMARNLGMRREWFQNRLGFPHYDLPPFRRAAALSLGAIEHALKDWLRARRLQQIPSVRSKPRSGFVQRGAGGFQAASPIRPRLDANHRLERSEARLASDTA